MLRLLLALMICWFFALESKAQQNLVPNPSFEEYTDCPTGYPDLDGKCNYWTSFRSSPDYMNSCSSICGFNNQRGYQTARSGLAYVGFFSFGKNNPTAKEQVGAELLSPLEIGVKYYVSFWVSCAYRNMAVNVATNKIGARFTTYQYNEPPTVSLPNNCHIYTTKIITDTLNWVQISGSFVADSLYRYIVIGSFFDDYQIDTTIFPNQTEPIAAYYYLEDVCVSIDPTLCDVNKEDCNFVLPTVFTPNSDNINDKYEWIQNCSKVEEFLMQIYNRWGQLVFTTNDSKVGWDGNYNGMPQPSSLYAVHVSVVSDNKEINKSTSITLFR